MAKLPEYPTEVFCGVHRTHVTISQYLSNVQKHRPNNQPYWTTDYEYKASCGCTDMNYWLNPTSETSKDNKVTKTFDTTATKSTALSAIQQRVEELERALYNKVHALAKVEAEHNKLIADANNALSNVMAQAYQNGIEEEDLELHLPDHVEELSERLIDVTNSMSLANVLETV